MRSEEMTRCRSCINASKWSYFGREKKTGELRWRFFHIHLSQPVALDNKFRADPLIYCPACVWRTIKTFFFCFFLYFWLWPWWTLFSEPVDIRYRQSMMKRFLRIVHPATLLLLVKMFAIQPCWPCFTFFLSFTKHFMAMRSIFENTKISRTGPSDGEIGRASRKNERKSNTFVTLMKTNICVAVNAKNHI